MTCNRQYQVAMGSALGVLLFTSLFIIITVVLATASSLPDPGRIDIVSAEGPTSQEVSPPWTITPTIGERPKFRRFPDTKNGIFVFADQIPPGNSDEQNRFTAAHYVGTQKMIPDDIDAIREYNPAFLHLHYQLAVFAGDSTISFIDGNQWVTDWGYVNDRDYWFLKDDTGNRIAHTNGCMYLMDVSGNANYKCEITWKEYWAEKCIERMRNNKADGVFADVYDVACVNADFLDPPYWWFEGTNPSTCWVPHLEVFGDYITEQLHAERESFYVLPNLGFQVTLWDPTDYSFADGGMIEGFAGWGPGSFFSLSDWKLQMNRLLSLIDMDKILICQSYMYDALAYDHRGFYLGCYLLIKGHHTYVNYLSGGPGLNLQYYPEYDIDLGPYMEEPPLDVDDLYDPVAGVYRREYEKGIVLVNPSSHAVAVDLGGTLYLTLPSGGGSVGADGEHGGTVAWVAVTEVVLGGHEGAVLLFELPYPEEQVAGLAAFHRSGQTFLTWNEVPDPSALYRVYRHDTPITTANLADAERIAEVSHGSALYANEWAKETDYDPSSHALQRNFIIEDRGDELPDGTGLLVWTPGENGDFYYAATVVSGGLENAAISSENSLADPVTETDDDPLPVLVWESPTGRGWVFTQFMDYEAWNPTFDGYAYNYGVAVPSGYDGSEAIPLTVYLDGWGTRYKVMDGSPYDYPTIYLSIDDMYKTWYFGNAVSHDYDDGSGLPAEGLVGNYTEWRILRAVDDIIRDDLFSVDENRIYAFGGSMGGSGAVAFGMRYPDVFAAVFGAAGMTDYQTAGDSGGTPWENDLAPKWGEPETNLGVVHFGPRSEHLVPHDGTGVWDWMNHRQNMIDRVGDEMAYIATGHGDADDVIDWETQGAPWYPVMEGAARRGFSGTVHAGAGHYWFGFGGCGPNLPFESFVFRKDRSFPAFSNFSMNTSYMYNHEIEWSCPWHDFAGDIVDTRDRYEIVLRIVSGAEEDQGRVDITPRRFQAFEVLSGASYVWENESLSGGVVDGGTVQADEHGLLLVEDFLVTKGGNRLVIYSGWAEKRVAVSGPTLFGSPGPNPFRSGTSIRFNLSAQTDLSIEVYDIRGRMVRKIADGNFTAGRHFAEWDGRDWKGREAPAGVYLIRMNGPVRSDSRKVIKLH